MCECRPLEVWPDFSCKAALHSLCTPNLLHLHPRGNLDLPHLFPFFGNAQLEVLSVITVLLLLLSQAWVCFHVKERVLLGSSYDTSHLTAVACIPLIFPQGALPKDLDRS